MKGKKNKSFSEWCSDFVWMDNSTVVPRDRAIRLIKQKIKDLQRTLKQISTK